jgi:hypothetical protein
MNIDESNSVDDQLISFLRQELSPLQAEMEYNQFGKRFIEDVSSLVAYEDPYESPQNHLFELSNREYVADATNFAMLG